MRSGGTGSFWRLRSTLSSFADRTVAGHAYDGTSAEGLRRRLRLPRVALFESVTSTLDVAHDLADGGAPAGTLVLADEQTAGRGRHGRSWRSESGAGIWSTLIERPRDRSALDVLSLRIGLAVAPVLDGFAGERVRLKWPNDLYVAAGKLAGVLIEARWRDAALEWVAIGLGVNVRVPSDTPLAAGLPRATSRVDVLAAIVPAMRDAAQCMGALTRDELAAFAARDLLVGRECVQPVEGQVIGIDSSGSLLVSVGGERTAIRAGSLVLRETKGAS